MKTQTLIAAAIASIFAVSAAAPVLAAEHPVKRHRQINRMLHRADTNHDGKVSQAEMLAALGKSFAILDTNHDGVLSKSEIANRHAVYKAYGQQIRAERKAGQHVAGIIRLHGINKHFSNLDTNHDGVLSQSELDHAAERLFKHRDANHDGYLSKSDFKA